MDDQITNAQHQIELHVKGVQVNPMTSKAADTLEVEFTASMLSGYPKAKLIAHLEKSLNAFIQKTKKEEVL